MSQWCKALTSARPRRRRKTRRNRRSSPGERMCQCHTIRRVPARVEWEKGYTWALGWAFVRANRELACLPRTHPAHYPRSTTHLDRIMNARAFTFFAFLNSCLLNQRPSLGRVRPRLCFSPGRRYVYLVAYLLALRCMLGGYHVKSLKSPTAWTFSSHFSEAFFSFLRHNVSRFCSTSGLTSDLHGFFLPMQIRRLDT